MSKALSVDLRDRVIAAIEDGMSCRQAAARFRVSAASAIRWRSRVRRQGHVRPGCCQTNDKRSPVFVV